MRFSDLPLTTEQLADHLISDKGLEGSREDVLEALTNVGYYRLKGYWHPFLGPDGVFKPGTTIDDIWSLYTFDRQLRLIALDAIERFEVYVRGMLANRLAVASGDPFGYLDSSTLPNIGKSAGPGRGDEDPYKSHAEFVLGVHRQYGRSKKERLLALFDKYPNIEVGKMGFPPNWEESELWR